jgi:hypothetical protein
LSAIYIKKESLRMYVFTLLTKGKGSPMAWLYAQRGIMKYMHLVSRRKKQRRNMLITNKTSVWNDEERKADMMKWADRKGERKKREHEQPLAMNLDKEKRPMRGEGLILVVIII